MTINVVRVASVNGSVEAEVLRGLLEAQGIEATLSHEAAGTSFGLSVGPLGRVDILVKQTDEQAARDLIDEFRRGEIEGDTSAAADGEGG